MDQDPKTRAAIDELRRRYPWPAEKPSVPPELSGWFCGENQATLRRLLSPATRVVAEIGSWQGLSAMLLVDAAPNAAVICIDHWLGSPEHHRVAEWKAKLPTLFETFCSNLWPWRDRLVPMRATSVAALVELHALGIMPEVLYVDGSHDSESVYRDVSTALKLFPAAWLVGDDGTWESVRAGIGRALEPHPGVVTENLGVCWSIAPRVSQEAPA